MSGALCYLIQLPPNLFGTPALTPVKVGGAHTNQPAYTDICS